MNINASVRRHAPVWVRYQAHMPSRPRILALFGARVIFGAERENIESLVARRERGCEVLCLVRDEEWNRAIPEALAAHGLTCAPIPYIDGWLSGWRLHIL